jgi:succinate-semialdehyde dehydrogenase/glutarate-semialdehyde dehydrogenase
MDKRKEIITVNPRTGEELNRFPVFTERELAEKLSAARSAFQEWRRSPVPYRQSLLENIEKILLREKEVFAALIQTEMGKSREEALAEVEKCATCARYYRERGPEFLAPQTITTDARESGVVFMPLGPVLAIMPWNFPFWQAFRCLLPALLSGNTLALKHASSVSGCAMAIERIIHEASNRTDLFQTLLIPGDEALSLIARPEIAAVSFTGSTEVGRKIAAEAGRHLKKCVLELGGSDAYVILEDADLAHAARESARSRLINAGQSCISAKRFIVVEKVREEFTRQFVALLQAPKLAPLARADLRDLVHQQVRECVQKGARLLTGGEIPAGPGYFYPATVLTDVKKGMPAYDEEIFGPVAAIIPAKSKDHALRIANDTRFGLGAAIFTRDLAEGQRIAAEELEAGSCFVNAFVRSDPRLPFGGVKESGFGRELSSFGIREFTNIKTIYVS